MTNGRIDRLNHQLKAIKEAFDLWKDSGLNKDILVIYIMHKTKMSKKHVKDMLESQTKFFDELMKEETVKRLKDGQ